MALFLQLETKILLQWNLHQNKNKNYRKMYTCTKYPDNADELFVIFLFILNAMTIGGGQ